MALFVPLDVDFPSDPKFLRAGPVAGYLYFAACALMKRTKSDGFVAAEQLATLCVGFPGKPEQHAARLVESDLWVCVEGGWVAPAYVKRNPTRAQVDEKSERKRAASVKANHERWHTDGKRSDDCPHCIRPASEVGAPSDPVASPSTETPTETESEAAAVPSEREVEDEVAARVDRRRRNGEDIGPGLIREIRADVRRDLALRALGPFEDPIEPPCEECRGYFITGMGLAHATDCPKLNEAVTA